MQIVDALMPEPKQGAVLVSTYLRPVNLTDVILIIVQLIDMLLFQKKEGFHLQITITAVQQQNVIANV